MKLSDIRKLRTGELTPVTIPVGDDALHLLVRPDFYNRNVERTVTDLQAAQDAVQRAAKSGKPVSVNPEMAKALVTLTIELVASWDLEDDDGKLYPLTLEGTARIPLDTLVWVWSEALAALQKSAPAGA